MSPELSQAKITSLAWLEAAAGLQYQKKISRLRFHLQGMYRECSSRAALYNFFRWPERYNIRPSGRITGKKETIIYLQLLGGHRRHTFGVRN